MITNILVNQYNLSLLYKTPLGMYFSLETIHHVRILLAYRGRKIWKIREEHAWQLAPTLGIM